MEVHAYRACAQLSPSLAPLQNQRFQPPLGARITKVVLPSKSAAIAIESAVHQPLRYLGWDKKFRCAASVL